MLSGRECIALKAVLYNNLGKNALRHMFLCHGAYDLNIQSHHRHINHLRNVDILVLSWSSTDQHTWTSQTVRVVRTFLLGY